jgi:cbb3-type cytochrome oxidase subunit 1
METTQASSKRAQTAEERQWSLATHPLRSEIKLLFLAALIVFIITVGIGVLNGQRLIQLSHDVLLTHVHSGTLGWITLSVFATSLIIFGNTSTERSPQLRWLSILLGIGVSIARLLQRSTSAAAPEVQAHS